MTFFLGLQPSSPAMLPPETARQAPAGKLRAKVTRALFRRSTECVNERSLPGESPNLDVLRAMAVGFVLIGHFLQCFRTQLAVPTFWDVLARTGVMLFFVHTSLVLMLSLDRMNERNLKLIESFYLRRLFRIYPLSILCIGLVIFFHIPSMPSEQYAWKGWNTVASNLLLAQNLTRAPNVMGALWSLPWEVQMYCVLPFIYLGCRKRPFLKLLGIWSLCCAAAWISHPVARILTYFPCFLGGILAYTILRKRRVSAVLPAYLWPPLILLISWVSVHLNPLPWARRIIYPDWILCLVLGLMIPLFINLSKSGIVGRTASIVAKYSYGIYLSHIPLMWLTLVRFRTLPLGLRLVWFVAMLIIIPVLAYHLVEEPLVKIGKQLSAVTPAGAKEVAEPRECMVEPSYAA
jgi:peptidoglycan/LPS O-acetylase OafA/YrhL